MIPPPPFFSSYYICILIHALHISKCLMELAVTFSLLAVSFTFVITVLRGLLLHSWWVCFVWSRWLYFFCYCIFTQINSICVQKRNMIFASTAYNDFEIHLFTLMTTEELICKYYRRFKHSLMLQKEIPCIKSHLFDLKKTFWIWRSG